MENRWKLLVVDDEPDMHSITRIALRRRRLYGERFAVTSVYSGARAQELLLERHDDPFDVAVIDGVMENITSGFDLCRFIRANANLSVPIILRTGIYGERHVLHRFGGIYDVFLAKAETTADDLFEAIQACVVRSPRGADKAVFQVA